MTAETGSATGATYQPDASFVVTSSTEQEDITKPRQAEGRPPRMTRLWTTYSEGEAGQDLRRSLEEEAEGIDANIGGNDGTPKRTGRDGAHRPLGDEIDRDKHIPVAVANIQQSASKSFGQCSTSPPIEVIESTSPCLLSCSIGDRGPKIIDCCMFLRVSPC